MVKLSLVLKSAEQGSRSIYLAFIRYVLSLEIERKEGRDVLHTWCPSCGRDLSITFREDGVYNEMKQQVDPTRPIYCCECVKSQVVQACRADTFVEPLQCAWANNRFLHCRYCELKSPQYYGLPECFTSREFVDECIRDFFASTFPAREVNE